MTTPAIPTDRPEASTDRPEASTDRPEASTGSPEAPAASPGTSAGTPEHEALLHALQFARDRALGAVEGLDDDTMRRAVLPSGWTPVGLLSHLTHDIERFWFGAVVAADAAVIAGLDGADPWHPAADVTPAEVARAYRAACARSDEIVRATAIDTAPAWWPGDLFGDWRIADLRGVLLHVVVETASHAGHLDAARELVDGTQWLVLT